MIWVSANKNPTHTIIKSQIGLEIILLSKNILMLLLIKKSCYSVPFLLLYDNTLKDQIITIYLFLFYFYYLLLQLTYDYN